MVLLLSEIGTIVIINIVIIVVVVIVVSSIIVCRYYLFSDLVPSELDAEPLEGTSQIHGLSGQSLSVIQRGFHLTFYTHKGLTLRTSLMQYLFYGIESVIIVRTFMFAP